MADKTPVRVVFNASNVATGMAEFQSGETVAVTHGGTGLSSIGSAGQILKVNAAGSALEFSPEGDVSITNLVAPTNSDLTFSTSGTGNIILDSITVRGTTLSSADSSAIQINEGLNVDGSLTLTGSTAVTSILDEDAMGSNSATALATQQSIKAYVDTHDANIASDTLTFTNKTFDVEATGNSISNIDVADLKSGVLDTDISSVSGSDDTLASAKAIKTYVDAQVTASDLDFSTDDSTALSIDLDSETLHFAGGTGLTTSSSTNTVTFSIDTGTVVDLTTSQTLTNKILTSPTIATPTITGNATVNEIVSNGSNADLSIEASGTGDINLTAGADVNIPANIGLTFGNDAEKIEGDGTDLTITGNNIKLTPTADVVLAVNTGLVLDGSGDEKIESDGTDISFSVGANGDINIPADIGLTFGNDGEKIEGDGTDLTITGNNIQLVGNTRVQGTLDFGTSGSNSTASNITIQGVATFQSLITNDITTNGSNADLNIEPAGAGKVKLYDTYTFPSSDGSSGQALVTDGSGTLSFDTVATTVSDDTLAKVRNNKNLNASARTIDSFNTTFNDSAWYMMVHNDLVNEVVSTQCFAVSTNGSDGFLGANRGIESAGGTNVPTLTADVSNTMVRVRAAGSSADCKTSFYKIPLSSANTADATRGNTVTTSNTDVDSSSESIDTFAHATFRGAKYFISIDNDSKTEVDTIEALVVHDGSDAYITSYGGSRTGNNELVTLSAAISGDNVVVSAAGLETNLNLTIHKILIKDTMTAESNANQKAFAAVTVSSTATAVDTFDLDDANGAVYYIVSKNASESSFAISEVFAAAAPGVAAVADGPQVSTKGTPLLEFSAGFDTATENSFELFASSTAGGSTTVTGYRISALAG